MALSRKSSFDKCSELISHELSDLQLPCDVSQPFCKFCLESQEGDSKLLSGVCSCTGSMSHVHGRCLVRWQSVLRQQEKPCRDLWSCELCGTRIIWPAHSVATLITLLADCRREIGDLEPQAQVQPQQQRQQPGRRHRRRERRRSFWQSVRRSFLECITN